MTSIIKYSFLHGVDSHSIKFQGIQLPLDAAIEAISNAHGFASHGVLLQLADKASGTLYQPGQFILRNADVIVKVAPPPSRRLVAPVRSLGSIAAESTDFNLTAEAEPEQVSETVPSALYGTGMRQRRNTNRSAQPGIHTFGVRINTDAGGQSGRVETHRRFRYGPAETAEAKPSTAVVPSKTQLSDFAARHFGLQAGQAALQAAIQEKETIDAQAEVNLEATTAVPEPAASSEPEQPAWPKHPLLDVDPIAIDLSANLAILSDSIRYDLHPYNPTAPQPLLEEKSSEPASAKNDSVPSAIPPAKPSWSRAPAQAASTVKVAPANAWAKAEPPKTATIAPASAWVKADVPAAAIDTAATGPLLPPPSSAGSERPIIIRDVREEQRNSSSRGRGRGGYSTHGDGYPRQGFRGRGRPR